jgi:predicted transcriptional regulator
MSRDEIKSQSVRLAEQWQALLGTNGIESKADLARYLGVARARVTQVLNRLLNHHPDTIETADFTEN